MCNLSDGIEKRGIERGIEKGKREVILELLHANQSLEFISKVTKFSKEKDAEIALKNGIACFSLFHCNLPLRIKI